MHDFGIVIDRPGNGGAEAATAASAVKSAAEMNAKIIIVVTNTGATARLFSSHRGPVPIVAFCDNPKIGRSVAVFVCWGSLLNMKQATGSVSWSQCYLSPSGIFVWSEVVQFTTCCLGE